MAGPVLGARHMVTDETTPSLDAQNSQGQTSKQRVTIRERHEGLGRSPREGK